MPNNVIIIYSNNHGVVASDTLRIFNTDEINDNYAYQSTLADLVTGEYYIATAHQIYILDEDQSLESWGIIKPKLYKYENFKNVTATGKNETSKSILDYLVIYRPSYSTDSDWKEDWYTIDMELTTNTTLFQSTLYSPWWFYYFNHFYQTVNSETFNLDDTVTPVYTTARKITYNAKDKSIDLEQDSV